MPDDYTERIKEVAADTDSNHGREQSEFALHRQRSIVLISCVSQKLTYRTKAQDVYTSTLFKLNLQYARILQPDNIFILSAKYGLLPLDRTIKPYEQTLNTMRSAEIKTWASRVLVQLKNVCCLDETECIFLAGEKYRKHLLPHLRNSKIPLEGLRIGEQLQKLKALCNEQ